jgi:hypothetical protein
MKTRQRFDLPLLVTSIVALLLPAGCAKVADPLPPLVQVPATTKDLRLTQLGTEAQLTFPTPPPDIGAVAVYKQCGPEVKWEDLEPLARVELSKLPAGEAPGRLSYADPTAAASDCRYAIRLVSGKKRLSPLSNVCVTSPVAAPLAPTNLRADVRSDEILVTWDPPREDVHGAPARVVGYLVNGKTKVPGPSYEDKSFQFGKPDVYYVQAVSRAENPLTLSVRSQELTVTPVDIFGPKPPTTVSGLLTEGKVQLVWDASEATDFKAYRVYRGTDPARMDRVAEVTTPNYTDTEPPAAAAIYYQISVVDQLGNEGAFSELVRIERPEP